MKPDGFHISPLKPEEFDDWVTLSLALFTDYTREEMEMRLKRRAQLNKNQTLLAKTHGRSVGFVTVSIRNDHVEGTSTSPVGYLESIYVAPEYRNRGVARALFQQGESWCRDRGCSEMGSDTWQWNREAQQFHEQLGFREENILVHFHKKIEP